MVVKMWENGDKYEGNMEDGKKQGRGILNYADGGQYDGEWANDMRNGYGVNKWANGDMYEGDWKNNQKHGEGKLTYVNGGSYTGEWKNNMRHGQGINKWPNGNQYEGSWKNNEQNGQGTFTYKNGGKHIGEWSRNMRNGYGVNTWANGDRYKGLWESNKKHGKGTFYHADGTEDSGVWSNDRLDGHAIVGQDKDKKNQNDTAKDQQNKLQVTGVWVDRRPFVLVLVSKSKVCPYLTLAREFAVSLQWDKAYFDSNHDHCYCNRCYKETWNDVIDAGNSKYVIPRGWVRLGLSIDPVHMKTQDIWNKWIVTFHGTTKIAAQSIIAHRQFCLPGDVLIDGTKLAIRPGHIPGQDHIYTSPTIAYSSCLAYSPIYNFHSQENDTNYQVQIVLQCRQMPDTYDIGPETIGAEQIQICPHIPNSEIEYFTDRRASLLAYGLLVRFRLKNN